MKLLYIVPGAIRKTMGTQELERRVSLLREWSFAGAQVDIIDIEDGPLSIESTMEEYLAAPGIIDIAMQAEKDGYDGIIIGCFDDPAIDAVRETVNIPVVGPGEASLLSACLLGTSYSIISILDNVIPALKKRVKIVGVNEKMSSIRPINIPVLDLPKNINATIEKVVEASIIARDQDGADILILGCMSLAFLDITGKIEEKVGIPVLNPAKMALKTLEGLVSVKASHSKKAYPYPIKWEN